MLNAGSKTQSSLVEAKPFDFHEDPKFSSLLESSQEALMDSACLLMDKDFAASIEASPRVESEWVRVQLA